MDKLKPCPICGAELQIHGPEDWKPSFYDPDSGGDPYNATCKCGFSFSTGTYDHEEFFEACNRRAILPDNKALTVEELRGMGGEPVWIDDWYQNFNGWELSADADDYFNDRDVSKYGGQWSAYRRQLEKGE